MHDKVRCHTEFGRAISRGHAWVHSTHLDELQNQPRAHAVRDREDKAGLSVRQEFQAPAGRIAGQAAASRARRRAVCHMARHLMACQH